jgi:transcriptional accessory protein Tex/SPT6
MHRIRTFLFFATLVLLSSCARIYSSPDAKMRADKHKIIAIVPPKVSIAAQKKVDAEALKEQQKTESINFQREMYSWLLKRKMQNKIHIEVLDVETTNAKLKKAGYFDENPMSPAEAAEVLGVDAIITSNFALSKPVSEGGALAVGILFGVWTSTNSTKVSLELHDKGTKKLLWNYNHEVSGSVGSTPARLVDNLMRDASKKMPYSK